MKIKFDASFLPNSKSASAGIIIRDCQAQVMGSCAYPLGRVDDPTTVEALACLRSISFALDLRFRSVEVEGDSLIVIKKMKEKIIQICYRKHFVRLMKILKKLIKIIKK